MWVSVRGCAIGLSVALWVSSMSGQALRLGLQATPSARPVTTRAAAAGPPGFASSPASSEKPRALLDRYCVTCHNDRVKTANLSLQGLDLTKAAEQAEVWEKVIRKLRAGVMPPPDIPRPPLPDYEALRDWLENEIDRVAATIPVGGAPVQFVQLNSPTLLEVAPNPSPAGSRNAQRP